MRKHSEETKQKMRESHKGKQLPQETKDKIREGMLAYWKDRKVIEAAIKRAGFEVATHKHSEETKQKMREAALDRALSEEAKAALKKYQEDRRFNTQIKQQLENEQKGIHQNDQQII